MTLLNSMNGEPVGMGCDPDPPIDSLDISAVTVRAPGGHLMCLARVGSLVSVARITSAVCGTDRGCDGLWHCMTGRG